MAAVVAALFTVPLGVIGSAAAVGLRASHFAKRRAQTTTGSPFARGRARHPRVRCISARARRILAQQSGLVSYM